MTETYLYLTTIGRKTGNPHTIEIWFVEYEGRYYLISEYPEQSDWVRNILHNPAVTFSIGTQADRESVRAQTQSVGRKVSQDEEPEVVAAVAALMQAKYKWSSGMVMELRVE